ncbi:MAG TPA: amidohydrolase family protein [Candidatus Atribacteria bacterium]|nr:amidohydrolase family protein [Candidatus Atribacteria bacterium]
MEDDVLFKELFNKIEELPVVDCHEHILGPKREVTKREPLASLIEGYVQSDLLSAGITQKELDILNDNEIETEKKWGIFEKFWKKIEFTAYAKVTKLIMRDIYGEEEISLQSILRIKDKIILPTEENYDSLLGQAHIEVILSDALSDFQTLKNFIDGELDYYNKIRFLFPLPQFHNDVRSFDFVQSVGALLNRHITSLEDYLEVVYELLEKAKERGIVGIKDQSAYTRSLDYELVPRYEAERLFNEILSDPRNSLGWPEAKPLDDFLFHQFMNFAGELKLPVQIHTGHMAGIRNRIEKTNAVFLTNVLELYQDLKFDLFHGNWPYIGEILFLAKNYPNVYIDLCWVNIIDPIYSEELYSRAILTTPHTKINGFGGDYPDAPEYIISHLKICRENIARALVRLIRMGWIDENSALEIARDCLFNNPKELFNLS